MELTLSINTNKENRASSPSKDLQKLRIELNDKIFEIKKITEDHAEEKGKLLMDFARQKALFQKNIKELKERLVTENQIWTQKVDDMRNQHQIEHQKLIASFQQRLHQEKLKLEQSVREQFKEKIILMENKVQTSSAHYDKIVKQMQLTNQKNIKDIKQSKLRSQQQLEKLYQGIIDNLKKDSELKLRVANLSLNNEAKLHLQLKEETGILIANHVHQKIKFEAQIKKLKQKIKEAEESKQDECKKLDNITEILNYKQKEFSAQLKKAKQSHEIEIKKLLLDSKKKESELFEIYKSRLFELEGKFQKLKKIHSEKQNLWEQRAKSILDSTAKRQSKKEDMKTIEHLQVELIRKEFELEREKKELKNCKLELDNMDEVYGKIFVAANYTNKRSNSFKVKRMRIPNLSYLNNRSTIDNKVSFQDDRA